MNYRYHIIIILDDIIFLCVIHYIIRAYIERCTYIIYYTEVFTRRRYIKLHYCYKCIHAEADW